MPRNDMEIVQANALMNAGRLGEAIDLLRKAAQADARDPRAPHMLGVALAQAGRLADGEAALNKARRLAPKSAPVLSDLATVLILGKRSAEALPLLEQARRLDPAHAPAAYYQGVALANLDRPKEALAAFDALEARQPGNPAVQQNRAALLVKLGRLDEALAAVDALLARAPTNASVVLLKASILVDRGDAAAAVALLDIVIAREPRRADAHVARGAAKARLGRPDAALADFERATQLDPADVNAWLRFARALFERNQPVEAGAAYEHLLARVPDHAEAQREYAAVLLRCAKYEEAAQAFEAILKRAPETPDALGQFIHARRLICDWRDSDALLTRLKAAIDADQPASTPFPLLALDVGPARLRKATANFARRVFPAAPAFEPRKAGGNARIRVAYLCGEFRDQATSYLMAQVYEQHDRARFDVYGVDTGARDNGVMRPRIEKALGGLREMASASDREIAQWLVDEKIDIAVNLNGWFGQGRNGVFALRPCPAQVNFLGYPGTIGADYFDYIIGDPVVTPPGSEGDFVEKIIRLPECYQPNDSSRAIAPVAPARAELGLPEAAFVFCCFNNFHKIEPSVFDVWMRLLTAVDGSVLWLIGRNEAAQRNLRAAATARGVDPARLVFAPYARLDEHLARHARADLFLDTLPHNAHTTMSDALWAGLPALTCVGDTFAGRVGASLLGAVGLPELVTTSLADYEALALRLAREPSELAGYRARLAQNRTTMPLFDCARYTRHLERAFEMMVDISRNGEAPRAFDVPVMAKASPAPGDDESKTPPASAGVPNPWQRRG